MLSLIIEMLVRFWWVLRFPALLHFTFTVVLSNFWSFTLPSGPAYPIIYWDQIDLSLQGGSALPNFLAVAWQMK